MSKRSVLIVEDDEWLSRLYVRMLDNAGYRTLATTNPWGAIQAIDGFKPDVIILDLLLTGSTGFALLHELQSYIDTSKVPIVLCSNLTSDFSIDDLEPYGIKRALDKTVMLPEDLITAVGAVLR